MARPKKDKELRHKHQVMLRLTNTEYEIVSENAKAATLPLAEYARKQVVLCQEKVQVKRGLFAKSMKSYSAVFRDHLLQIIQFG